MIDVNTVFGPQQALEFGQAIIPFRPYWFEEPVAPVDAAGLRHFTIELPDEASLSQVAARLGGAGVPMSESSEGGWLLADPSRNRVHLSVRGA